MYVYTYVCVFLCMYVCVPMYVYMYVCTYVCMYVCTYACMQFLLPDEGFDLMGVGAPGSTDTNKLPRRGGHDVEACSLALEKSGLWWVR